MVALWNRADYYIFILWFFSSVFFFHRLISAVAHWMSTILPHKMWPYSEFTMQVWNMLHAARCKCRTQKSRKNRHVGTIAQLCWAVSSQLRNVSTIGKKLVKQHMSSQYGELRPTSGWDRFVSLGHPSKFQPISRLIRVTARQSSSERQPNFAALNRRRHLCSAGRSSRWAMAHILVSFVFHISCRPIIGRYVIIVVCLSAVSNFAQKFPNGFAWNFQRRLAMGQWTND